MIFALVLSGCGGGEEKPEEPQQMVVEEQPTETAPQGEPEPAVAYIPGLEAANIKLNLQQDWGFEFTGLQPGDDISQDNGRAVDLDTGLELVCNIFETSPFHVQWVDFVVNASSVAGFAKPDLVTDLAKVYFGYCATVPYDDAEPEKARQWVEENVDKATKAGNVLSTRIGSVQFDMFGTEYFRTLRVKPIEEE